MELLRLAATAPQGALTVAWDSDQRADLKVANALVRKALLKVVGSKIISAGVKGVEPSREHYYLLTWAGWYFMGYCPRHHHGQCECRRE
jgi:hypothetical protein